MLVCVSQQLGLGSTLGCVPWLRVIVSKEGQKVRDHGE